MASVTTRRSHTCPVYGLPSKLPDNQLPTVGDVMRYYMYVKDDLASNTKSAEIIHIVSNGIVALWQKASIPTVSQRRVDQKVETLHQAVRDIAKKKSNSKAAAVKTATDDSSKLFDISACQCIDFATCSCPREIKVPVLEQEFLVDQRNCRKMIIGNVDTRESRKLMKRTD